MDRGKVENRGNQMNYSRVGLTGREGSERVKTIVVCHEHTEWLMFCQDLLMGKKNPANRSSREQLCKVMGPKFGASVRPMKSICELTRTSAQGD